MKNKRLFLNQFLNDQILNRATSSKFYHKQLTAYWYSCNGCKYFSSFLCKAGF